MGTAQRILCIQCVIETCLLPALAGVTGFAVGAKAAQVHVVDAVAAIALLIGTFEIPCLVTLVAAERGMLVL